MKLPFLKAKNASNLLANTNVTTKQEIEINLNNQLKIAADQVHIKYEFICSVGRKGEKFAAKLAEKGDEVFYSSLGNQNYHIAGTTTTLKAKQQFLKEKLFEIVDSGNTYGCILKRWSIEPI